MSHAWYWNGQRMSYTWPIRVRGQEKGEVATATLQITDLNGPGREHFSLTHEVVWRGFGREDLRSCGVLSSDRYLRSGATPFNALHVVPLAMKLHLCNVHTGAPMHPVANARHHAGLTTDLQGERYPANAAALARHLRITVDEAKMLIMEANAHDNADDAEAFLQKYIDTLLPRWASEASDLRDALDMALEVFM
jgi:hypothetical protein